MIYFKRFLWLFGLMPVSIVLTFCIVFELFTFPLKMFIQFILNGSINGMKITWLDFIITPFLAYLTLLDNNKQI